MHIPSTGTTQIPAPRKQRLLSTETGELLEIYEARINELQTAKSIWQDVLSEDQQQSVGGELVHALQRHGSMLHVVSAAWKCEPDEALVRLLELHQSLPSPRLQRLRREMDLTASAPSQIATPCPESSVPHWDKKMGELWFRGKLARQLASVSRSTAIVPFLDAFQSQGWPKHIEFRHDNQRLNDRVKSLNRDLMYLRFRMDGTGGGVIWMASPEDPLTNEGIAAAS